MFAIIITIKSTIFHLDLSVSNYVTGHWSPLLTVLCTFPSPGVLCFLFSSYFIWGNMGNVLADPLPSFKSLPLMLTDEWEWFLGCCPWISVSRVFPIPSCFWCCRWEIICTSDHLFLCRQLILCIWTSVIFFSFYPWHSDILPGCIMIFVPLYLFSITKMFLFTSFFKLLKQVSTGSIMHSLHLSTESFTLGIF